VKEEVVDVILKIKLRQQSRRYKRRVFTSYSSKTVQPNWGYKGYMEKG